MNRELDTNGTRAGSYRIASWLLTDRAASYRVANGLRLMSRADAVANGVASIRSERKRRDRD
ncbi:hypothetical protein F2Q70_00016023 [Brassica cretica]|uniref:Uncharacterized protein n=1 Tax=Brassica cretica TaxID=69181 RepID=A0A8S9I4R6_BRACR|nr:hypothetical protein F2Q70_00016023 [Brassica cretica]KAF2597917.1 hypothetical protein F2Q68_00008952 [Brassica cretica]